VFYRYQSTNTDAAARRNSIYELYWYKSTNADAGPQFTCFTSTKSQILTQQQGQRAGIREHTAAAVGGSSSGVTPAATLGGTGKEKESSREGQVVQGADISENHSINTTASAGKPAPWSWSTRRKRTRTDAAY
jgi:hypothetical protein